MAQIARGLQKGKELITARSLHLGTQVNGWTINYRGPRFGRDYLLRAAVAKDQIFVAIPEEAIYPVGRVDSRGQPLSGAHSYRIRFAPGELPPVNAFWSVTAYDDQGFMIPNSINRYSVGDRSDLVRSRNGGVTIVLDRDRPADVRSVNWLPIGDGAFYLMMRLYLPTAKVLQGDWVPPPIEREAN